MFCTRPPIRPKCSRSTGYCLACALLVLFAGTAALAFGRGVVAATTSLDTLIQVLFGDLPRSDAVDANNDGAITGADVVALATGILFSGVVSDLVPHAVGDQLVYQVTYQDMVTTETTTAVSSDPGGDFVIDDKEVDSHQQVQKHERQSYTDTGTKLYFGGFTDESTGLVTVTTCDPPLLRMVMPLIAGQSFPTTIHCVVAFLDGTPIGFVDETDVFTPIEIVDSIPVLAGTFTHVVHISGSRQVTGAALETHEIYFASGVGPILDLMTIGGQLTRTELVSGTIGGVPVKPR